MRLVFSQGIERRCDKDHLLEMFRELDRRRDWDIGYGGTVGEG